MGVGKGAYMPDLQLKSFFLAEPHDQEGSKYTQNLSFIITKHIKLVLGKKSFPTARESPPKSANDPKCKSKKLKLALNFHLQKELEV